MSQHFPYSSDNKRYHTWNYHLRQTFGKKIAKVGLDAGFGCPNLDGSRGWGGCSYCMAALPASGLRSPEELSLQFRQGAAVQRRKWPEAGLLAYFQAGSNTHAAVRELERLYGAALCWPDVAGLCIATRADCLDKEVVRCLQDLAGRTWLVVELGLQTVHERTARRINRCHSYREFLAGFRMLREAGIRTCVHLINGLPGETRAQMLESVRKVAALQPHSIKLHMLHMLRGTALGEDYGNNPFALLSREEYVSLVCDQLELLPAQVVVQRLTGDPVREELIAPDWTLDKRRTLNSIDKELARRDSWQGKKSGASQI